MGENAINHDFLMVRFDKADNDDLACLCVTRELDNVGSMEIVGIFYGKEAEELHARLVNILEDIADAET